MELPSIDGTYVVCAILFIVIIALDMRDKRYKAVENFEVGSWRKEPVSNINFGKPPVGKPNNYGNFGTDGRYPPKMRCYDNQLDFNCSNYVYNWNDKNMNVCNNQKKTDIAYLPGSKYIPPYVLGKSPGRVRQCTKLI